MSIIDFTIFRKPTENLLHGEGRSKYGKGRIISFDPKDRKFSMARAASFAVTRPSYFWETGPLWDQGFTSECVAYSAEALLLAAPTRNKLYLTHNRLYNLCKLNDEWDGVNYDGTSVRAVMKVLQAAGLIGEYVWATDIAPVRAWLLMKGPVILGTNWYTGMYNVNPFTGFIRPTGQPDGGHAYMLRGADDRILCPDGSRGAVRVFNSWGLRWGQQGKAWLSYRDADALIKNYGEAVTPVEMYNTTPKIVTGVV
jgi:hypothetical protein